ncbi:MAG: hypothetical protein JWL70_1745, partial [Acidimicrobiia bacterium]|nr:hypothetical protein [Acidimicrobiia bacterium]
MGVVVSASDAAVQVAPGAVGVLTLRIRNTGGIVEGFSIEPLGELAPFVDVNPPLVNVLPGQDGMATVTIRPPRSSQPAAGAYPLGLRVKGRQDTTATAVEEVHVTVSPFVALDLRVVPQNAKGRRSATLRAEVANTGNSPAAVRILASDPDDALAMTPAQQVLNLGPGERTLQSIVVRARDRPFRGQPEQHPFLVSALGADGTGPSFTGQYKQMPVMPSLAVSGGTVAALIAAGAAVFVVTQKNDKQPNAAAAVTTVAGQSPTSAGTAATDAGAGGAGGGGGGGGAPTTAPKAAPAGLRTSFLAAPFTLGPDVSLTSGGGAFFVQASGGATKVPTSAKQVLVSISVLPPEVAAAPSSGGGGGSMIDPSKIRNLNRLTLEKGVIIVPGNAPATTAAPKATTGTLVAGPSG